MKGGLATRPMEKNVFIYSKCTIDFFQKKEKTNWEEELMFRILEKLGQNGDKSHLKHIIVLCTKKC